VSDRKKRLMGVDIGEVRIGLALSDTTGTICTPLKTLDAKGVPHDQETIARLAADYEAEAIVVGLPVNMDGSFGLAARKAQAFCRVLRTVTDLDVITYDERLTSHQAESQLRSAGVKPSRNKSRVDSTAAALILESYLASHADR
jgi:putative Holliday junction resolvase